MLKKFIYSSVVLHLSFWVLSYTILLSIFSIDNSYFTIDYIYTSLFVFSLAIPVYLNRLLLIPFLLHKNRYAIYSIAFIALIFIGALFNELIFNNIVDLIFPSYYIISSYKYEEILLFFLVFMVLTTLLKMSRDRFRQLEIQTQLARLEEEKTKIELKSLKDHINPHFLFNSLNVVFSLIGKNSKKAEEATVQLSDILRFMIYQARQDQVKITEEVNLIENYLSLQRKRIEDNVKIRFEWDVQTENPIAPLLLLPLVENCFKHGISSKNTNPWIEITLESNEEKIEFNVRNSMEKANTNTIFANGSGLNNIKERLNLIYPKKHKFVYKQHVTTFHAQIIIYNDL